MSGKTNKGAAWLLMALRNSDYSYCIALVVDTPTADTNTMADLTEIAAGNGYASGGQLVNLANATLTEDDTNNLADLALPDVTWYASNGPIPASGDVPTHAVLTDANPVIANRQVFDFWPITVEAAQDSQLLTITGHKLRITT